MATSDGTGTTSTSPEEGAPRRRTKAPETRAGALMDAAERLFIDKGIAAKDLLIDAAEAYCAGADFETGGACNVPTSKTIKAQLAAKVQAAITGYEQAETDIRALIK